MALSGLRRGFSAALAAVWRELRRGGRRLRAGSPAPLTPLLIPLAWVLAHYGRGRALVALWELVNPVVLLASLGIGMALGGLALVLSTPGGLLDRAAKLARGLGMAAWRVAVGTAGIMAALGGGLVLAWGGGAERSLAWAALVGPLAVWVYAWCWGDLFRGAWRLSRQMPRLSVVLRLGGAASCLCGAWFAAATLGPLLW
ncbi:hypothetical protein [Calidithermus terrae]|uniref:hypothetical protein n=1 Tax=Calidithermus terrae TaxID=1408545 RepID=UPI0011C3A7C4|nr:hypothetical protein [Calidithermus terrae]